MSRLMTAEASMMVDLQDGTYMVEVVKIEDTELDGTQYGQGIRQALKFTFALPEVLGEDGEPIELTASATAEKLTPKTKLWAWASVLLGAELQVGQSIDIDALIGCRAFAAVANEEDKDKNRWARIKSLVSLPRGAAITETKAPPAAKGTAISQETLNRLRTLLSHCRSKLWPEHDDEINWFVTNYPAAVKAKSDGQMGVVFTDLSESAALNLAQELTMLVEGEATKPEELSPDDSPFE